MGCLFLSPRLDPVLFKKCQGDATRLCHTHGWNETSELMPPGAVFSCLYRHAYRTEEQGRRVIDLLTCFSFELLHEFDVVLEPDVLPLTAVSTTVFEFDR